MKQLAQVTALFQDQAATKVVTSLSKDGLLHAIVAGSVMVVDDNTMAVAEVFMHTTSSNLEANGKVALLAVKGMESYLVNATVEKRHTDGSLYDGVAATFAAMNLPVKAVWTFTVDAIYNQGAGPDAGKQLY